MSPAGNDVATAVSARFASSVAAPVTQADTNAPALEPEAVPAVNKLNNIALPLNVQNQFTSLGLPFTAYGLAKFVGTPYTMVTEVRRWEATLSPQAYQTCILRSDGTGCINPNTDFALDIYGNYMVKVTSALNAKVVSFVGDVPDAGSVHFHMVGASPCKLNAIVLPLDQGTITLASKLAAALGGASVVSQVRYWTADVSPQAWTTCLVTALPGGGSGCINPNTDFQTKIGYPYWVCLKSDVVWP